MKKATAFIIMAALFISLSVPVLAHSGSLANTFDKTTRNGTTYIGTEATGWLINESEHSNSRSLKYKRSAGMSVATRDIIYDGADLWNAHNGYSITYTSNCNNLIMISSMAVTGHIAEIYVSTTDSNGHFTSWTIAIKSSRENELTDVVIAHEFGHVFGLGDLSSSSNNHKLMYEGCHNGTPSGVSGPTSADIWGSKVITGYHTSHSWEYVYVSNDKHRHRCTSCGGYKTQGCTPNSSGYCTKCGHYVSNSGNGVSDPTAALLPNADEERRFMIGILI